MSDAALQQLLQDHEIAGYAAMQQSKVNAKFDVG